jgi:hypothetical protein
MKELSKEYRNYLRNIGELELLKKRKTIFINTTEMTGHSPWKFLDKEKKLYYINQYIISNNLDINIKDISKYTLRNIVYTANPGIIKSMDFYLK